MDFGIKNTMDSCIKAIHKVKMRIVLLEKINTKSYDLGKIAFLKQNLFYCFKNWL